MVFAELILLNRSLLFPIIWLFIKKILSQYLQIHDIFMSLHLFLPRGLLVLQATSRGNSARNGNNFVGKSVFYKLIKKLFTEPAPYGCCHNGIISPKSISVLSSVPLSVSWRLQAARWLCYGIKFQGPEINIIVLNLLNFMELRKECQDFYEKYNLKQDMNTLIKYIQLCFDYLSVQWRYLKKSTRS